LRERLEDEMKRLVVAVLLLLVIGWLAWKWQPTA
jgi:hypothetical protein